MGREVAEAGKQRTPSSPHLGLCESGPCLWQLRGITSNSREVWILSMRAWWSAMACFLQDRAPSYPRGNGNTRDFPPPPNEVLEGGCGCWGCPACAPSVMGSVRLATALAPSRSEDLHAFGSVGPINSTSFSSKDSVPDMPTSSWRKRRRRRRAREKKALRKTLGRRALPEGCCPQSRMRETVMSPLEMGERWGQCCCLSWVLQALRGPPHPG